MPTLSSLFPFSRLAVLRRAPFWAQAAAVCALFAVAGVVALDDYGAVGDEIYQRRTAIEVAAYTLGVSEKPPGDNAHDSHYGVAFEMPLLLAERALGLQDTRHIHLTRHLLTHLFFIAGGFACGMLAYRMLGSRWAALMAMLLFLLHPRLYAHSFFNTKDIPFAAMLVIALYLTHRAFRRDTFGAFLLCGIGVGLAINLRVFGLMLLPMIVAMRALDILQAGGGERKRILMTGAAFLAAAVAALYISHPYYWESPLRFVEGILVLSQHPTIVENLFMGEAYLPDAVPWNFIPVWFAITTPPVALALGVVGCAAVCWQAIARPLAALRDRETRFLVMLLGCVVLPVAVVIALQSNVYNGWRHMYFIWGPFCLLAAVGLYKITNIYMGGGIWKIGARLPRRISGGGLLRGLAYGVVGVGLISTLTAMAALHPHQQVYFNALVDTETPGALAERYDMDYWHGAHRQLLERLLTLYPDDTLRVYSDIRGARILPRNDRERIVLADVHEADFYLNPRHMRRDIPNQPALYSIQAYGSVFASILAPNSDAYRDYHRATYDDVEANGTLLARSDADVYIHNGELLHLNANCAPLLANAAYRLSLHIFPSDPADLPPDRREYGFENLPSLVIDRFAFFDGKCIHRHPLPDYPIARIRTGNHTDKGRIIWRADIDLAAHAAARAVYERIAAGDHGQPAARSDFDVYLRGKGLAYLKENCSAGDTDARFFLHIFPADPADLPADWRDLGFENLDFQFVDHGADIGGKCVAERELPGYAIGRIRTGQFVSGEGRVWGAEFPVGR